LRRRGWHVEGLGLRFTLLRYLRDAAPVRVDHEKTLGGGAAVGMGHEIAVLLTVAVLILTGGCGSDGENDPGAGPSEPSTPSASAIADSKK